MKTKILSRKTRITAIITALALLLTVLCCMARPTFASADDWNEDEFIIDPDHVCTNDCYRNIFYLTDNPSAEYYVDTFLRGLVNQYAQQHIVFNEFRYYDLAAMGGTSWRLCNLEQWRFGYPPIELQFYPIHDALVIFELNELLPFQFSDWMPYQPTAELYGYFSMLKSYNCKIMFICNTDEVYFNDKDESNRFLDLVDVHINTDIYSFFTETFLTFFTQKGIGNSTIILDRSMAEYAVFGDTIFCEYKENYYKKIYDEYYNNPSIYGSRYGFIDGTLIPHIRKTLKLPITTTYDTNRALLQGENINVLCYVIDEIFYDLRRDTMYYWPMEPDKFMEIYGENIDHFYFVGSSRYEDDTHLLRRLLINIEDTFDISDKFDKYMFVEHSTCRTIAGERNMHIAGLDDQAMASFITPIVAAFLFDDIHEVDWSAINNWDGRCEVTVKPTSDDSWLLLLSDPDNTIGETEAREYYGVWY